MYAFCGVDALLKFSRAYFQVQCGFTSECSMVILSWHFVLVLLFYVLIIHFSMYFVLHLWIMYFVLERSIQRKYERIHLTLAMEFFSLEGARVDSDEIMVSRILASLRRWLLEYVMGVGPLVLGFA